MKYLVLLPINDTLLDTNQPILRLDLERSGPYSVRLSMDDDGCLSAQEVMSTGEDLRVPAAGHTLVGLLHVARSGAEHSCYLLRCHPSVVLDGAAPPLSLATIEAGSILSIGLYSWLLVHLWKATPQDVPASFRHELCPVCSGPLSLAPVVQCNCGRLVHLQTRASAAESAVDVLECFLAAGPCNCGIAASLRPQMLPARAHHVLDTYQASVPSEKG